MKNILFTAVVAFITLVIYGYAKNGSPSATTSTGPLDAYLA